MELINIEKISEVITTFFRENSNRTALFAGAGVSIRAGLPSWKDYLSFLAEKLKDYGDNASFEIMTQRISSEDYVSAAQYYKMSDHIPEGEKYRFLSEPFSSPKKVSNLNALISLPFTAVFTTNYDRSIHDSFAQVTKSTPIQVERNDESMRAAVMEKKFYIARLHGSYEIPQSIVISKEDYIFINNDNPYIDLLTHSFTQFGLIIIGFSFLDPAIVNVLDILRTRRFPNYPSHHIAFLPDTARPDLIKELSKFNIRTFFYSSENDHSDLWNGVKLASRSFTQEQKVTKPTLNPVFQPLQRFFAISYAKIKSQETNEPLRELIIDGIIEDLLIRNPTHKKSIENLAKELVPIIRTTELDAKKIVYSRTNDISNRANYLIEGDVITFIGKHNNQIEHDLILLTEAVLNRLKVRNSFNLEEEKMWQMKNCLEEIILQRGWDLGASYLGVSDENSAEIVSTIDKISEKSFPQESRVIQKILSNNISDLFINPDRNEDLILSNLARISFALQLVLNAPNMTISQEKLLPDRIYLDSNFLMPFLIEGHPFNAAYSDALNSILNISKQSNHYCKLCVFIGFLEEVIGHRNLSKIEVSDLNLEDPNELENYIRFNRAEKVNVFIGGYGSFVGRQKVNYSFENFLKDYAPYDSVDQLAKYLESIGIHIITLKEYMSISDELGEISPILKSHYLENVRPGFDLKKEVLIRHEAEQLALLQKDIEANLRSIFVTADTHLQRLPNFEKYPNINNSILSNLGLIQFVDLIIGVNVNTSSISRLMWGSCDESADFNIINYFTALALKEYDEVKALLLPQILDKLIPKVMSTAKLEGVYLLPGGTSESRSRTAKFLDRFEEDFYRNMAEAMEKYLKNKY